jgi:hypothetical protein
MYYYYYDWIALSLRETGSYGKADRPPDKIERKEKSRITA